MPTQTVRRVALPTAVLITAAGLVGVTTGAAAADDSVVSVAGSHPAWANAANDAGAAPAAEPVLGQIVLKLRDPAGARQLALAVATPGSASYRKTVTPRQWIDRFSPDATQYAALVARLRGQGLTITGTPESRLYVTFTGTAALVAAAFDTPLHRYSRHGSLSTAPATNAKLPASMAGSVSAVDITEPAAHLQPASYQPGARHPAGSTSASTGPAYDKPCSSYYGQYVERVPVAYGQRSFPTVLCGYEPKQIRSAYGADALLAKGVDGHGLTIAFTDAFASPTLRADVNTFSSSRGEPTVSLQQIVPSPSDYAEYDACGGEAGWQVEQTLDAIALHDVAPKASLLYVGAADCDTGFEVALSTILDRRLADVVSNSWGAPDALVNGDDFVPGQVEVINNLSLQAAAEGIGLYFCSGDEGDGTDLDGVTAPWFPASLPFVTAVGGTSVGIDAQGKVALETGWGPTFDAIVPDANGTIGYVDPLPGSLFFGGAGGGQSTLAAEPAYQKALVPNTFVRWAADGAGHRGARRRVHRPAHRHARRQLARRLRGVPRGWHLHRRSPRRRTLVAGRAGQRAEHRVPQPGAVRPRRVERRCHPGRPAGPYRSGLRLWRRDGVPADPRPGHDAEDPDRLRHRHRPRIGHRPGDGQGREPTLTISRRRRTRRRSGWPRAATAAAPVPGSPRR